MKIKSKDFCVPAGEKVRLEKWLTQVKKVYSSKKKYHKLLKEQVDELSSLQRLHYASNQIFGTTDISGDGRRRQGRCHPPYHVRCQSTRLPGIQF